MSFPDESFDVVLSSALLHFADNEDHWKANGSRNVESAEARWNAVRPTVVHNRYF
jgi:hypothetical protein